MKRFIVCFIFSLLFIYCITYAEDIAIIDMRGEIVDSEKPIIDINSVQVSDDNVTVGDIVVVSIKITDNVKVNRVVIDFLNIESNKLYTLKSMIYNQNTDRWEYIISIDENTPNGKWAISYIQAYDEIGNEDATSERVVIFKVYGAADSEKPVIEFNTIESSLDNITVGESTTISIKITDNIEMDRVVIDFKNTNSNKLISLQSMYYNKITDKWEYNFSVDSNTPNGKWVISYIMAYDLFGNNTLTSTDIYVFTVYGAADSEKPFIDLNSLEVSQTEATLYDKVKISISITDNIAMDRVTFSMINRDANNHTLYDNAFFYNKNTEKWEFYFEVCDTIPDGNWYIGFIDAYDIFGNANIIFSNIWLFSTNHIYDFSTASSLQLPNNIKIIGQEAFMNNNLGNVVIPYGCKTIEELAFANSTNILRIFIPPSVTYIANNAFDNVDRIVIYSDDYCYAQQYADDKGIYFVLNKQ